MTGVGLDQARDEMVRGLQEQRLVRDPRVAAAFRSVPRHAFLPDEEADMAYVDAALPIGGGQTISAPHMVAIMAEGLDVRPGHRILEVGGGSGYHAAILAHLAGPTGRVVAIERLPDLARQAESALAPLGLPVEIHVGDGSLGWPAGAPYDRISVACAAPKVPAPLLDQLAPEGILLVPVGPRNLSSLLRVRKTREGDLQEESLGPCVFVPLIGAHGWPA